MKRSLLVSVASVATVLALAAPFASAQVMPPVPPQVDSISVVGEGVVLVTPDTARITVGVEVSNRSLSAAQADAANTMAAIVERMKAAGLAESDIRTVSFSVTPQYDQSNALRDFRVQNLVEIKTTDVAGLGGLMDQLVDVGATRIYGIRFEAQNMAGLKDLARDQAMQNARAKADQLTRAAGVGVGRPIRIEESDTGGVTPIKADEVMAAPAARSAAAPTPIQPGELQVRTTVRVVWAIQ